MSTVITKLRGVQPEKIQKRMKALFYGVAGAGKTMAAISFPKPYLIDTEKGATNDRYVDILKKSGGVVFQTSDFDELLAEVKALLTQKHPYKTLIIDPLTILYNDLLDKSALKVGTEFGRHYGEANKYMKHLLNLLLKLDLNVILTCHAKNEYGPNLALAGQTYDGYKKLDYLFDLVFEIQKQGHDRVAIVKKTRMETFPEGENFPFSYEEIAKRYGKDILEKEAAPIQLANEAQIKELYRLIELLKVTEDTTEKWLKKAEANSFEEMNFTDVEKCLDFLKKQIQGPQSAA